MLRAKVHRHAAVNPHRPAVIATGGSLTYGQLDALSARTAASLRRRGIGPGAVVALYLPRTADAIVALLGVLGSGAAYTFVEDDGNIIENVGRVLSLDADLVITTAKRLDHLRERAIDAITAGADDSAATAVQVASEDAACILSTSGSTGVPKGVVITHGNIRHYVESLLTRLGIDEPLCYAHVSTLSADLGNTCVFLPLWTGGTVHLVDDDTRKDPIALLRYLRSARVDVLKITPSHWNVVFQNVREERHDTPVLRHLILGGEVLTSGLAADILCCGITRTLVNHYGPTEATIGVTANVLSDSDAIRTGTTGSVPIGTPFGRTGLLVRTEDGRLREKAAKGELYIGGPSVAAGYRNDPAATHASFIADLDGKGGRFYRTGDLVHIDADGVVEFLGRIDRQVKINGYRVELEHVETVIRGLDEVADAAAFHLPLGTGRALVCAVVTAAAGDGTGPLRARLGEVLPRPMVPARIVPISGDFPRNANGKTDLKALRRLVEARLASPSGPPGPGRAVEPDRLDPIEAEVRAVWRKHLGHDDFGLDSVFFDVGGDSLDAIQVIGDLQARGHHITAKSFLARPTVRALAARLRQTPVDAGAARRRAARLTSERFSAAQNWFFERNFTRPDHWNQAILLQADGDVDPDVLAAAARDLIDQHPLLRTRYRHTASGWRAETVDPPADAFTVTHSSGPLTEAAAAEHIVQTARAIHAAIDLASGKVFKMHLFAFEDRPDQILCVAHHLSVDAVSWRILFADLARGYGARLRAAEHRMPYAPTTFWDWVAHVHDHARKPGDAAGRRPRIESSPVTSPGPGPEASGPGPNLERDAHTVWVAFSRDETDRLARSLAMLAGLPIHAGVLGAFLQALGGGEGAAGLLVDVESHGRASFDDEIDTSRLVGWFTATTPIRFNVAHDDVVATVKGVTAALENISELDLDPDYRVHPRKPASPPAPRICYNYLGRFHFGDNEKLALSPSRYPIGPARGGDNDRVHDLKLTARIVNDHLVLDLSFSPGRNDPVEISAVMRKTRKSLLGLVGVPSHSAGQIITEPGSSTGLLTYVPPSLPLEPQRRAETERAYENILLTGATGYIGVHLLRLLLNRTGAHVFCLVRDEHDASAAERIASTYRWYFPGEPLDRHAGRYTIVRGDVGAADFGLAETTYRRLCAQVDAIYHAAGDTRLFGDRDAFHRTNVTSVRTAIKMARTGRPKDLHHLSTLAVAGVNPADEPVCFSEECLHVGQTFENEYERSKYMAEQLIHEFIALGGAGFIYRAGNVSGDSQRGRFQRNAGDNRLVQLLRAAVAVGRLPRRLEETIVLTPVDKVAEGVLALSRCPRIMPGTFHVDGRHTVSYRQIFDELRQLGISLEPSPANGFDDLLAGHVGQGDPAVILGHFWASRRRRNVRLDNTRTLRLLAELGVTFEPPDRAWLREYLRHLVDGGHLAPGRRSGGTCSALSNNRSGQDVRPEAATGVSAIPQISTGRGGDPRGLVGRISSSSPPLKGA